MIQKVNHLEVSVGGTEIIAYKHCPIAFHEIENKTQIFNNTICCSVNGQGAGTNFTCSNFIKATYDNPTFHVECVLLGD